jgi:TPR repeat protein
MDMLSYIRTVFICALLYAGVSPAVESGVDQKRTVMDELDTVYPSSVREFQKKLALKGDKVAQYTLGNIYHFGTGVAVDIEQARSWYSMAAELKHEDSINQLTFIEIKQTGFKEALHAAWYDKLLSQVNPTTETTLIINEVASIRKRAGRSN